MTTINKLTRTDTVGAGDIVPVYVQSQGDARGAAMSVIQDYMQSNLAFESSDPITQYSAPSATGFSVQINDNSISTHLILTPTTGFSAGTIVLPLFTNLTDRQLVIVNCTQAITTLTINKNGATALTGAPITLAANAFFTLQYDLPTKTWYRIA